MHGGQARGDLVGLSKPTGGPILNVDHLGERFGLPCLDDAHVGIAQMSASRIGPAHAGDCGREPLQARPISQATL
jgi:hypothetical protein